MTTRLKRTILVCSAVLVVIAGAVTIGMRYTHHPVAPASPEMIEAAKHLAQTGSAETTRPTAMGQPPTARGRLISAALALQGIPYKWGAKGPRCYDCSGFTKAAYAKVGVGLPDGSFNQAAHERPLRSANQLAAGDLLFYRWPGKHGIEHVTMYAGNGWVIGTGTPGEPPAVTLYPLSHDLADNGLVLTYRHITLSDER